MTRQQLTATAMAIRYGRPLSDPYALAHVRDSDAALARKRAAERIAAANYEGPSLSVSRPGDSVSEAEYRRKRTLDNAWHNRMALSLQDGLQVAAGELAVAAAITRGVGLLGRVTGKVAGGRPVVPGAPLSQAAIRARVKANIAENAAARSASKFNDPVDGYVYEVQRPLIVKAGDARPWFGEAGQGAQFRLDPVGGARRSPSTLTTGPSPYLKEIYRGKYWDYKP